MPTQPATTPPATTTPTPEPRPAGGTDVRQSVCLMIEASARAHNLPLEFFARVIWQESRLPARRGRPAHAQRRPRARDRPVHAAHRGRARPARSVRSGAGAAGSSAEFLLELADQFGNLGLAAAAYNAGPQRVRDPMAGARTLPAETRNYVYAITGISVDEWARSGQREPVQPVKPNCEQLMALLHRAPNPFVAKLEERVNLVAGSPWGVQLSAGFSRDRALASYAEIAKRYTPKKSSPATTRACSAAYSAAAAPRRSTRCASAPTRARPPRACAAASAAPAAPAWCCATARA